jgi:hypothetical protein
LLNLFETSGVIAVLAGHIHSTNIKDYNGIKLVISGSISINGDSSPLGFRLWHIDSPTSITHEFIPLTLTLPTPDFNGDGIVDAADMCIMVDHWQADYPLCDIAPMPWRDGIVDVHDLTALAEFLFVDLDDPTLLAHWALDEKEDIVASDSKGSNDGYVIGDAIWEPNNGQLGGALRLDGIDDYISVPAILNPADGPLSVLVWVKGGGPGQAIISEVGGPNWLSLDPLTGHLMTGLKGSGRGGNPLLSQTIISDDNWHRIGFAWDGLHRKLYVDSTVVAEDLQSNLQSTNSDLYIGCDDPTQSSSFFSGLIDDVRIYNRAVHP